MKNNTSMTTGRMASPVSPDTPDARLAAAIGAFCRCNGLARFNPSAALFDMDGTLYDSMPRHARAWKITADARGLDCTEEEFFAYEGRTGASTINILFNRRFGHDASPAQISDIYAEKTRHFRHFQQTEGIEVMPGAQRLVSVLRQSGLQTILVTGSGQGSLLDRLDADFDGAFAQACRITAHSVTHGKPHPEPYLRAAALAATQPCRCIVFENAPLGVQSGAASGAFTVAVSTGPVPESQLRQAGADIVFDSMPQCLDAFSTLIAAGLL